MIRFIFVVLFVVLFLILSTPLMLVEWIIGKFNPGLKDKSSPYHCQLGIPSGDPPGGYQSDRHR